MSIATYDKQSSLVVIPVSRSTSPPAIPTTALALGYNVESTFNDLGALAALKAGGATYARWQPAWSNVESYASPGTYSVGSAAEAALAYCGAHGIKPIAVCGYGPPYRNVLTLTVAGGSTIAPGSKTIPVIEPVSSIVTPLDHVYLTGGTQIVSTGKWGYYGALVDSVDSGANSIVLASATAVALAPGTTLTVNRLLYASPADQVLTNPSLIAFFNYLTFVAGRLAANGCTGYVSIWNEPAWAHDPWDARGKFYDSPPGGMNVDSRMKMFLHYALALNSLPSGVRIISDATDKSGANGLVHQGLAPTSAQVSASLSMESIHPYGNIPEQQMWDRSHVSGSSYSLLNPTVDSGSNFTGLARDQDVAAVGLGLIATECGADLSDDYRQAVYLLRRAITCWACLTVPVIYALAEGSPYNVTSPTTYAPRQSYTALARLMTLVGALGGAGGSATNIPTLIGYSGHSWPLMMVGVYGASGSAVFLWQRTGYDSATTWCTWPSPPPANVYFQMPVGSSLVNATDLVTGSPNGASVTNGVLTVPNVGESAVAVVLTP